MKIEASVGDSQHAQMPAGLINKSAVACGMAISPWGAVLVGSDRGAAYRHNGAWQMQQMHCILVLDALLA